jgi:hypothetical protein
MTDFDAEGRITLDTHYEHDANGTLLGWRILDGRGALYKRFEVKKVDSRRTETLQYDSADALEYRFLEEANVDGDTTHRTFDPSGHELPSSGSA